jgi:hypothetical protein
MARRAMTMWVFGVTLFGHRVTLAAKIVTSIFGKWRPVTLFRPAA